METADPYRTLGLTAQATATEVKHAYRKLARRFHPDVSKEPDAEARFKELATAYERVGTSEARAAHDAGVLQAAAQARFRPEASATTDGDGIGIARGFEGGFGFRQAARSGRGGKRAAREDAEWAHLQALMARARGASGASGAAAAAAGTDQTVALEITIEDAYTGTQRTLTLPGARQLEVNVPAGVRAGQLLRLAGLGAEHSAGGSAGDLLLRVVFAPHSRYRVEGADLSFALPLAPWEAALGAEVACATPAGDLLLRVPRGCTAGQRLRLKGRGFPPSASGLPAGDAFAEVQLTLPSADTPDIENAYRAFESACSRFQARPTSAA